MPDHTETTLQQFQTLIAEARRARVQLYTRQVKAEDEGDMPRANALHAARKTLEEASKEIARAQHDFLLSQQTIDLLLSRLGAVIVDLRKQRDRMQKANSVLDAAAKIVGVLNNLRTLLTL